MQIPFCPSTQIFEFRYLTSTNCIQKFRVSGPTTADDKFEAKRSFQKAMVMQFGQIRSSEIFQLVRLILF